MRKLVGTFGRLGACKVMVVGDLMLDTYTIGKVRRISPEAPVAVVQVLKEEHRPGGAGNVILNLVSLGVDVIGVGRIGQDNAGQNLCDALVAEGISTQGIFIQKGFRTPLKNRVIADNQQIVRVDHEEVTPLHEMLEQQIIETLPTLMQGVNVIAISDYGKGFLSRTLLNFIMDYAKQNGIPTIADPKGLDFTKYAGATIIKPNLSEAISIAALPHDASLDQVAVKVLEKAQAEMLMITRSEAGISIFHRNGERQDFPVRIREVKDVTGAGDTVLAMLSCALANGLDIADAVQLSNVAAGIAIERFGCARITLSELAQRLLEFDVVNKVFDEEHLFALQQALKGKSFTLLGINCDQGLTSTIFRSIRQLSQRANWQLLVYIRDEEPSEEIIAMIASLHEVNFILIKGDSMRNLCERIAPNEMYIIENNQLQQVHHTHALLN